MKSCSMILKDGCKVTGVSWDWNPTEGYMTVAAAVIDGVEWTEGPYPVNFADIASGTTERSLKNAAEFHEMEQAGKLGNPKEDLLDWARECGWRPDPLAVVDGPELLTGALASKVPAAEPELVSGFVGGASDEAGVQVSGFKTEQV